MKYDLDHPYHGEVSVPPQTVVVDAPSSAVERSMAGADVLDDSDEEDDLYDVPRPRESLTRIENLELSIKHRSERMRCQSCKMLRRCPVAVNPQRAFLDKEGFDIKSLTEVHSPLLSSLPRQT